MACSLVANDLHSAGQGNSAIYWPQIIQELVNQMMGNWGNAAAGVPAAQSVLDLLTTALGVGLDVNLLHPENLNVDALPAALLEVHAAMAPHLATIALAQPNPGGIVTAQAMVFEVVAPLAMGAWVASPSNAPWVLANNVRRDRQLETMVADWRVTRWTDSNGHQLQRARPYTAVCDDHAPPSWVGPEPSVPPPSVHTVVPPPVPLPNPVVVVDEETTVSNAAGAVHNNPAAVVAMPLPDAAEEEGGAEEGASDTVSLVHATYQQAQRLRGRGPLSDAQIQDEVDAACSADPTHRAEALSQPVSKVVCGCHFSLIARRSLTHTHAHRVAPQVRARVPALAQHGGQPSRLAGDMLDGC